MSAPKGTHRSAKMRGLTDRRGGNLPRLYNVLH